MKKEFIQMVMLCIVSTIAFGLFFNILAGICFGNAACAIYTLIISKAVNENDFV
jgi:hypothetical protein